MVKNALIIAAGSGSRLQGVTGPIPKTLHQLAGVPLLKRILLTAHKAGVERFVVVTGYEANQIQAALSDDSRLSDRITWVHNKSWKQPNGISVLAAREALNDEPFALLMADHLFEEQTLHRVLNTSFNSDECLLAIDRKINTVYDLDDATKVYVEADRVVRIGKELSDYNAVDTGMFVCTSALFEALEEARTEKGCSLSDGIQILAQRNKMRVTDIGDGFWQDVDTPEMLEHAENMLLKRLRKPTDGIVSRHINRPISTRISRYLVRTPMTPNQVTLITFATGLASAWFVMDGAYWSVLFGTLLFQLSSILDGCDGEVAKLKFSESRYGSWLDTITDNLTYVAFFFAVIRAYTRVNTDPFIRDLGMGSVAAVSLSILLMYYYLTRTGDSGSLVRYNEAFQAHAASPRPGLIARFLNVLRLMSKRDFFTMLLLVFAVFGQMGWMYWTVTIGGLATSVVVFISTGKLLGRERTTHESDDVVFETRT